MLNQSLFSPFLNLAMTFFLNFSRYCVYHSPWIVLSVIFLERYSLNIQSKMDIWSLSNHPIFFSIYHVLFSYLFTCHLLIICPIPLSLAKAEIFFCLGQCHIPSTWISTWYLFILSTFMRCNSNTGNSNSSSNLCSHIHMLFKLTFKSLNIS
jgi:hypothetical protein